jgi:hypothetical protein
MVKNRAKVRFRAIGNIKINGQEWTIGYGHTGFTPDGRLNEGLCEYTTRRIVIDRGRVCGLLDVLAHEIIHARLPDLSEKAVNDVGELIQEAYNLVSKHEQANGRNP